MHLVEQKPLHFPYQVRQAVKRSISIKESHPNNDQLKWIMVNHETHDEGGMDAALFAANWKRVTINRQAHPWRIINFRITDPTSS